MGFVPRGRVMNGGPGKHTGQESEGLVLTGALPGGGSLIPSD